MLSRDPDKQRAQLANLQPWKPAPPLNDRSRTHGAEAFKTLPIASHAAVIYRDLEESAPLRGRDGELPRADETVVELLAACLARLESIGAYWEEHGYTDGDGQYRTPLLETERRLRDQAKDHAETLGLTPRARVALGLDLQRGAQAATLAELLSDLPEEES